MTEPGPEIPKNLVLQEGFAWSPPCALPAVQVAERSVSLVVLYSGLDRNETGAQACILCTRSGIYHLVKNQGERESGGLKTAKKRSGGI